MSLSVNEIIAVIAPQYSTDANLANTITIATQRTSETAFGVNYNYAIALRTSHMLTLRDMNSNGVNSGFGGVTGPVTSKSEGSSSISFGSYNVMSGTTGLKTGDLGLTRYGIELLGLIAGNIPGISVANFLEVNNSLTSEYEE